MASEIKVDTISEKTSANGVTIDSLSIKDGGLVAAGNIDVNGNNLVLDANANTYLDAGTDDTIKFYVAGAEDLRIAANAINVLSGTTLTIDSGATITNSGTASGFSSADPSSADGDTLGTASAEWSDLYLADGSVIYFGNDQEITLTHSADSGLLLKHTATADDKPINLVLQTGETDMAADDVIGKISFQAPDEGTGTDAILVSGAIQAVAEGDHSSSSNATRLEFMTGASEAATAKMSISSGGIVGMGATLPGDLGVGLHIKTADSSVSSVDSGADELVIEGSGAAGLSIFSGTSSDGMIAFGDSGDNNIGKIKYDHSEDSLNFSVNAGYKMKIDSIGAVTKPLQPAFLVRPASTQSDLAASTNTDVVFGTEVFDTNADFSTPNFTAPVTGRYLLTMQMAFDNIDTASDYYQMKITTSNRSYISYDKFAGMTDGYWTFQKAVVADMDASDTAKIVMNQAGGTGQADVRTDSFFSGCLLA